MNRHFHNYINTIAVIGPCHHAMFVTMLSYTRAAQENLFTFSFSSEVPGVGRVLLVLLTVGRQFLVIKLFCGEGSLDVCVANI